MEIVFYCVFNIVMLLLVLRNFPKPPAPPPVPGPDPRIDEVKITLDKVMKTLTAERGPFLAPQPMEGLWEVCSVDGEDQWHHYSWVREGTKAWKAAHLNPEQGLRKDGVRERGFNGNATV